MASTVVVKGYLPPGNFIIINNGLFRKPKTDKKAVYQNKRVRQAKMKSGSPVLTRHVVSGKSNLHLGTKTAYKPGYSKDRINFFSSRVINVWNSLPGTVSFV